MTEQIDHYEMSSDSWRPEELGMLYPALHFKDVREVERMIADKNQQEQEKPTNLRKQQTAAIILLIAAITFIAMSPAIEPNYGKHLGFTPEATSTVQVPSKESLLKPTPVVVFNATPHQ